MRGCLSFVTAGENAIRTQKACAAGSVGGCGIGALKTAGYSVLAGVAIYSAGRGVSAGSASNALRTGLGQLRRASKVGGQHLVRFGKGPESVGDLAADAARAEAAGFPHGVSTKLVERVSGSDKAHRSALKTDVEQHFVVEQTGRNPHHHTVHLPKPVTQEVADLFNFLFRPKD